MGLRLDAEAAQSVAGNGVQLEKEKGSGPERRDEKQTKKWPWARIVGESGQQPLGEVEPLGARGLAQAKENPGTGI